jgi:hypothetical protein
LNWKVEKYNLHNLKVEKNIMNRVAENCRTVTKCLTFMRVLKAYEKKGTAENILAGKK